MTTLITKDGTPFDLTDVTDFDWRTMTVTIVSDSPIQMWGKPVQPLIDLEVDLAVAIEIDGFLSCWALHDEDLELDDEPVDFVDDMPF